MNGFNLKNKISTNDHFLGKINSKISIVEFGDYECPHSKQSQSVIEKIISFYPSEICYAYRHFPMTRLHPHALLASIAAEAANLQNHFWEMHKALMESHAELNTENIFHIARHIGLDIKTFLFDIEDNSTSKRIEKNIQDGVISGVKATPTFFINNHCHIGQLQFESLRNLIEKDIKNLDLSI